MNITPIIVFVLAGLISSGCATNPYSTYYRSNHKTQAFLPPTGHVEVSQIDDGQFKSTVAYLKALGWVCVGSSDFTAKGGFPPETLVIQQAQHVSSDKVVVVGKIIGKQTIMAVPTFQPGQTVTTEESGNFISGLGDGYYSGTATTTTSPQFGVQYVPCDIDIYEVGASFWRMPR